MGGAEKRGRPTCLSSRKSAPKGGGQNERMSLEELLAEKQRLAEQVSGWKARIRGLEKKIESTWSAEAKVNAKLAALCTHEYEAESWQYHETVFRCKICGLHG